MNRPTLRILLLIACTVLCAGSLAACGEDDERPDGSAASAIDQTLAATAKVDSARLTASFQLDPDGTLALGGPIRFSARGPFDASAADRPPRFDFAIAGSILGSDFAAGALSTGDKAFLKVDGRDYAIGSHGRGHAGGADQGSFAALGLDPRRWLKNPRTQGNERVGGADTVHVAGTLDARRLLADLAKLLDGEGAPGAAAGGGLLTPKLQAQIADAVTSSKVDVWTGAQDKILRQLAVVIDFAFAKDEPRPITGLDGGKINLRLRLDDVNATTFDVVAPKRARPLSQLLGDGELGALFSGLAAGLTGGAGADDGGAAFLRCLGAAGGKTAEVMRCASKLAP